MTSSGDWYARRQPARLAASGSKCDDAVDHEFELTIERTVAGYPIRERHVAGIEDTGVVEVGIRVNVIVSGICSENLR